MTKRTPTLLEVCVARAAKQNGGLGSLVGELRAVPKGSRVCAYIIEWSIALRDGCDPEVRAVAAWWNEAERTAYRRNRDFRELFPEPNPERIARNLIALTESRKCTAAELMQLPAPALA